MVNPNPNANNSFSKTICSICYEDLKPIVEDLQAISICGHVFHELCLQQWFEYCASAKKQTCPVCKQGCSNKNVGRLYFQSVGDPTLSQSQIPISDNDADECREVLSREVNRLETKVSGLSSALEVHKKEVQQLTDELQHCKEQLSKEATLKNEVLRQKECIQSMLHTKSSDLVQSTLECSRLQEKNLALAKELASLKLVADCNLDEEEIVKLATFCNEGNSQDAVDVLKRSLVIRNKSYKELMTKCNSLGRGEARYQRKLEKAKEKIVKLKARMQELETSVEMKDNEILRSLKASKRLRTDIHMPSTPKITTPFLVDCSVEEKGRCPPSVINLDEDGNDYPVEVKETNKHSSTLHKLKNDNSANPHKKVTHFDCLTDDEKEVREVVSVDTSAKSCRSKVEYQQKCGSSRSAHSDTREAKICKTSDQVGSMNLDGSRDDATNDHLLAKEAPGLLLKDIRQVQPTSSQLQHEPDRCFAGGLLGPDGANMYLGKWCKRVKDKSSCPGDGLIAVGADGRGGKIKVLRPANQMAVETKESIVSAKRPKSSSLQSRGCLQIEHFFGKASN